MKKLVCLFCLFIAFTSVTGYTQSLIHLTAELNGANAVPPNDSPFQTVALVTFGTRYVGGHPQPAGAPPTGVLTSNTLQVLVYFTPSNLVNSFGLAPNTATIQEEAGNTITNLPAVSPNPNALQPFPGGLNFPVLKYAVFFVLTPEQATDLLAGRWYIHVSATNSTGDDYPGGAIRGQILAADSDNDGVPDYLDQCPNTPSDAIVDASGCSFEQLSPCDGPWKSHSEYVKCVKAVASSFVSDGLISPAAARTIVQHAERSNCGNHRPHH